MAIRDRLRRAVRRSDSASDTSSQTDTNTTTTTANTSQSSLLNITTTNSPTFGVTKTTTNLTEASSTSPKRFPWSSTSGNDEKAAKKQQKKDAKEKERLKKMHPSKKPLTAQNIKHQEMLSHFTMTFGATQFDPSRLSLQGVSPCCTRPASIAGVDFEHDEGLLDGVDPQSGHRQSMAAEAPIA